MHALAIALQKKGHEVTGSDDEIFEPARGNLVRAGILPTAEGWFPERITGSVDAVILGMHARCDNPELLRAQQLGINIYSFPEFLYNQTKDKLRIVIAGSHGKTTITSMVMHVLKHNGISFDYMVGSRLAGFDNMVELDSENKIAVFEGDEYLSSCLDTTPKFHLYRPQIALISGIAWDHINVFPTFGKYVEQFSIFIDKMPDGGSLVWCESDPVLASVVALANESIRKYPYKTHEFVTGESGTSLIRGSERIAVNIFGSHNMENLSGAKQICMLAGVSEQGFYDAISGFQGPARRLETLGSNDSTIIFNDFAHSPSKVLATVKAVKEQYPGRRVVALLELHTFSSLTKNFLEHYKGTMDAADEAVVFYNPATIEHKKLEMISPDEVKEAFAREDLRVITDRNEVEQLLQPGEHWHNTCLLLMSSGNFAGLDLRAIAKNISG